MGKYMTIQEFVNDWNYQCNSAEDQDEETLDEVYLMIFNMIKENCGLEEKEVPRFNFYNKKGQIELVGQ